MPVADNPIDGLWADQPAPPLAPVEIQPIDYAGELAKDKLARLAAALAKEGATHAVLTDPSSLAWAFNIRGSDVPHTPLALGFAILAAEGPHLLFIDKRKLPIETEAYLTQLADLSAPAALEAELAGWPRAARRSGSTRRSPPSRLRMLVKENGGTVVAVPDPARLPRATKNGAEIAGARAAHRRDGAAVAKLLAWLDRQGPARSTRSPWSSGSRRAARADRRGNADAAARDLLRHHRRRRAQRRDHALPRVATRATAARARQLVPARFRRPVSGRHDRHHPHGGDRHAERGDARSASPSCSRA